MSKSKLRVSHIVSGDAWGGLESVLISLFGSPVYRARIETTLIVLNEGQFAERARMAGVTVYVVPESTLSLPGLIRDLCVVIRQLKPHIIHSHRYKEILCGAILARMNSAQQVVTVHGYEPSPSRLMRWRSLFRDTACIVVALALKGQFVVVADHLRKIFMIPRSRCVTINNGIEISQLVAPAAKARMRDSSTGPIIGWVGRMVPVKGIPTLLNAFAQMTCLPLSTLMLVGDGPDRPSLERLASSLGIAERVHFEGFVDDIGSRLKEMDLFVLPSLHEGFPIALIEALGVGLPAVASSVGGIPQVLSGSGAGVLMESTSPSSWAKALTDILQDPKRMREMGECARKHIQKNFSIEEVARQYVAIYEAMVGPR